MRKVMILVSILALLGLACSDDDSDTATTSSSPGAEESESSSSLPVQLSGRTNDHGTEDVTGEATVEVETDDFYFAPTFMKVTDGQSITVHLKNAGDNAHTFTSDDLSIDEVLQPGQERDVQVETQGDAGAFYCKFHQSAGMQGSFFVTEGGTAGGGGSPSSPLPTYDPN